MGDSEEIQNQIVNLSDPPTPAELVALLVRMGDGCGPNTACSLSNHRPSILRPLSEVLLDSEVSIRRKAISAIYFALYKETPDALVIEALVAASNDADRLVCVDALRCLARLPEQPRIVDAFLTALESPVTKIRCNAADGKEISDPRYLAALEITVDDPEVVVAAHALSTLQHRYPGHPSLEAQLDRLLGSLTSEDQRQATAVIQVLALSPHPKAKTAFRDLLRQEGARAQAALLSLYHQPLGDLFEDVVRIALDGSTGMRRIATMALSQRDDPEAREVLVKIIEDSDPSVSRMAALGLGRMGDIRAIPMLRTIAETDSDARIRKAAERVIADLDNG